MAIAVVSSCRTYFSKNSSLKEEFLLFTVESLYCICLELSLTATCERVSFYIGLVDRLVFSAPPELMELEDKKYCLVHEQPK